MAERLTPRKQQALEMRSRIQNVALDLFDREGFENVSVEEIAQKAGCSVGNIYHYFKSKDELAIQVTSHVDDAYSELEEAYLADTARTSREKLLDFVGQSLRISSSDPVLYKAFIHAMKYPEQGALQRNEHRIYFRVLSELVELCRRDGFIDARYDGDMAVEYLVTLHRGTLLEWRIYEGNFDIAQRGIAMAEILSLIKLYEFPNGGSITLEMLPIILFAARYGCGWGSLAGLVYGTITYLIGNKFSVDWTTIICDYFIAFVALGFGAGLLSRRKWSVYYGTVIGGVLRFLAHFLIGVFVWGKWMPDTFLGKPMTSPWIYSLIYNGSYMLPSIVLCLVVFALLYKPLRKYFTSADLLAA